MAYGGTDQALRDVFENVPDTREWPAGAQGHELAREIARRHRAAMDAVGKLADEYGGGAAGYIRGLLAELARATLVSAADVERLTALFDHLYDSSRKESGHAEALGTLVSLHQAIVDDPASAPLAVAATTVAIDSVTQSVAYSFDQTSYLAGWADAGGMLAGSFGGPLGSVSAGYAASTLVADS